MINMIACISRNRGIGYKGELLFKIPEDLKLFNLMTCGGMVIMGKNTWDSLPTKPLEHRWNVVLTNQATRSNQHSPALGDSRDTKVTFVSTKEELMKLVKANIEDDIWIIGGQSLYEMFIEMADKVILTEVDAEPPADRFFPMFDCTEYAKLNLMHGTWNGIKWDTNIYQDLEQWKLPPMKNELDTPVCA